MTFKDTMLPVQPVLRQYFNGDEQGLLDALYDCIVRFTNLRTGPQEFSLEESDRVATEDMASSPMLLRFLQLLVLLKQPRRILEIGTFVGISTMYLANAMGRGGKIVTIEKFDHFAEMARRNFARNGLDGMITLLEGDAFEELRKLEQNECFDLIFLDGNKERYCDYFELLDPLLVPGGLLIVDDIFFHGDVLNENPTTEKGAGVLRFLERVRDCDTYHRAAIPIANGVLLMLKRN